MNVNRRNIFYVTEIDANNLQYIVIVDKPYRMATQAPVAISDRTTRINNETDLTVPQELLPSYFMQRLRYKRLKVRV